MSSFPETVEVGVSEEEIFASCLDSAHRIARSIIIQESGDGLETAVVVGVQMGADSLSTDKKSKVSKELLVRLYGKTLEELKLEQDEDIAREQAEWDSEPRFNNGQA